jgi:hypothetical protein
MELNRKIWVLDKKLSSKNATKKAKANQYDERFISDPILMTGNQELLLDSGE